MASLLPVIDFSPFLSSESTPEQKKATALEIDKACREVGFFYLKNHGVPLELMNSMLQQARGFFETATPEDKARIALRKKTEGGDNARGYLYVKNEEKGCHEVSLEVFNSSFVQNLMVRRQSTFTVPSKRVARLSQLEWA